MKLHFFGGAKTVTGANYLLEVEGNPSTSLRTRNILIDCGLFQGSRDLEKRNRESFSYNASEVDFVLITHAHLDHIGRLPKLVKEGFEGKIFATAPTIDFTRLMLEDSQKILEEKAGREGIAPPFEHTDVEKVMSLFSSVEYDDSFEVSEGIRVCFREAGHILGSAIIEFIISNLESEKRKEIKIVFSGDLGNQYEPIIRPPAKITDADYLVVESAYGDREHETAKKCQEMVEDVAEEIIKKKGVLLIPSFALERTQELLFHFNNLVEHSKIPVLPIFLDSPLALKATEVYRKYPQYYNEETKKLIASGDDIFKFPNLHLTATTNQSKDISRFVPPKIIIAGSGMSQGGRILHHEANYLPDPNNILLIISYQAQGTLGRRLKEGEKNVRILDREIKVLAKVEKIDGYSAHADHKMLFNWVKNSKNTLKKVFIVQGEEGPADFLAQKIKDHLGISVEVPESNQCVEL
jgi:metallo-beta-lactamase family protein